MNPLKQLCILCLLSGVFACTKNTLSLPEPALSLAGTYQTQLGSKPFPIKGETISIQIRPVAIDTVDVLMRAYQNGVQVDSLTYKSASVEQQFSQSSNSEGCINYVIYLTPTTKTDRLTMNCDEINTLKYIYVPAGQSWGELFKFKKI